MTTDTNNAPPVLGISQLLSITRISHTLRVLCNAAHRWYVFDADTRYYHNWQHALEVTTAVLNIGGPDVDDALLLAAIWHDAVYVPGAKNNANEEGSAAALLITASRMGIRNVCANVIEEAADLIRGTVRANHMGFKSQRGKIAILLDADISSLAKPWPLFCDQQDSILREMQVTVNPQNQILSGEFVMRMLSIRGTEGLYHTTRGRSLYAAAAHSNINRYHSGERA